jgi:hypothetical protein
MTRRTTMCGRFVQHADADIYASQFELASAELLTWR